MSKKKELKKYKKLLKELKTERKLNDKLMTMDAEELAWLEEYQEQMKGYTAETREDLVRTTNAFWSYWKMREQGIDAHNNVDINVCVIDNRHAANDNEAQLQQYGDISEALEDEADLVRGDLTAFADEQEQLGERQSEVKAMIKSLK